MTDEIEVTQADRNEAEKHWLWLLDDERDELVQAFARHRQAAFADGFTAALQGAEAAIWRIEDDAFLYENVSKALQEVISELQAMEQNWTGRATIEHRQAAIKERDAQIVAWLLNVYDTGSVDGLICRSDGAEDLLRMLGEVR